MRRLTVFVLTCTLLTSGISAFEPAPKPKRQKKSQPPFQWVNQVQTETEGLTHATFESKLVGAPVGYYILLPPGYESTDAKYPVVYYLHGGRPGSEAKAVRLAPMIRDVLTTPDLPGIIYVFVNGGPVSHYDVPGRDGAIGKTVFLTELIPHIDRTYRTIPTRAGRGLEGFSQGGRGTARILFERPDLFCSAAPGGGGFATEKRISESDGEEHPKLVFAKGDDAWTLAKRYARSDRTVDHPRILVHVGTQDVNYESNLAYMRHLQELGIPFQKLIVKGAPHSAKTIYEKHAVDLVKFHAESFRRAAD